MFVFANPSPLTLSGRIFFKIAIRTCSLLQVLAATIVQKSCFLFLPAFSKAAIKGAREVNWLLPLGLPEWPFSHLPFAFRFSLLQVSGIYFLKLPVVCPITLAALLPHPARSMSGCKSPTHHISANAVRPAITTCIGKAHRQTTFP